MAAASQNLRLVDLRAINDIVHEAGELAADTNAWRSHVLQSLIRVLGAQVAMTVDLADAREGGFPRPLQPLDIGWRDASVREIYYDYYHEEVVKDPGTIEILKAHRTANFCTFSREQLIDDGRWYSARAVSELRRAADCDDFICSTISWDGGWMQGFTVYRPWKARPFSARQRRMMRLCHLWLLRLDKTRRLQNARERATRRLPPRVAQTLDLLLAGASMKDISHQLNIGMHTVNDYVKILHRRLEVSSRTELINKCRRSHLAPPFALPAGMPEPPWRE